MSSEMIDKKFRKTHFPIEFCEMFSDYYVNWTNIPMTPMCEEWNNSVLDGLGGYT